ncbi:MAG: PAS-domain containing protein [Rhodobacteraceae bacterium]|nr:PAS-domain containing protein [Paracoccaceae bacterium]
MTLLLVPAAAVVLTSVATAIASLLLLAALPIRTMRGVFARRPAHSFKEQAIFLFDGEELIDATPQARGLLAAISTTGSDWDRLSAYLSVEIADFVHEMGRLSVHGAVDMRGRVNRMLRLRAERVGERTRLTLTDLSEEGQGQWVDGLSLMAQEKELSSLRETLAAAPLLIWRTDHAGTVIWANDAYVERAVELDDNEVPTWPLPALFPDMPAQPGPGDTRRVKLATAPGKPVHWYEWHASPNADSTLFFAFSADAIVKAELSLREFIQTLTKTFAQLPIGLAIFDRNRQLAMFNPALVELTSLDVVFLSARPTLFDFLDRLRERRVIPEPKNYRNWRDKVTAVEEAAASGLFEETWNLASGQTYRVTGQPHPDGALAFHIENISAETSLTRHFQSEIELGQEILDSLDEAIAIFSPAGVLINCNAAYAALWGHDPASTLGIVTVAESCRRWLELSRPTPVWGELRDFVADIDERSEWSANVDLKDGRSLACRFVPLSGGRSLAGFLPEAHMGAPSSAGRSALVEAEAQA